MPHPIIKLLPGRHGRVRDGHPWIYANEIVLDDAVRALPPGSIATLVGNDGGALGTIGFNPKPLIVGRVLSRAGDAAIDAGFLAGRLAAARDLRDRLFDRPFYRLVHAEADGLPGLIVDRFGDVLVVQPNTATMELLTPALLEALAAVLAPRAVLLRSEGPARQMEGLAPLNRVAMGDFDGRLTVEENGVRFLCDPLGGQKTGWFYDQRDNRAFVARLAKGGRMVDFYSYLGGFALQAAAAGARSVLAVDRSKPALELARQAAALNGVEGACAFHAAECFGEMERLAQAGERFEVVVADPPAFVKSRKDHAAGLRGYQKMARLAAPLVAPGGILFCASCSHNVTLDEFAREIAIGIARAGRSGRILRTVGAGPDHPVHPFLRESAYLKGQVLQLD
ncbi:MAG: class I SAM-dependent rRNA methyltransferase [Thalassobaculales bacterium]